MKRNAKLAYGGSADSKVGITRHKPLKRGRRKPRPSLTGFWREVTATGVCALADGRCYGPLQAHHYLAKQHLRHDPKAYADSRNGVCCCSFHHAQIEAARMVCPRPPHFDEFVADFGLIEREAA